MTQVPQPLEEEPLPNREPQAALRALPTFPDKPSKTNLFGVARGEVVDRRFDPARLHRIRVVDAPDGTP